MSAGCIDCNACCKGLVVFLNREDFFRVKQEWIDYAHGRPHLFQRNDHVHTCSALDEVTGRCRIYSDRPSRCQKFKENSSRCQSWRRGKRV